jgi:hypothetical protein
MAITPPIPDPKNTAQCLQAVKEIIELREGRRGARDRQGKYPNRFITAEELESLFSGSEAIVNAILSISPPAINYSESLSKTISGGVITVTDTGAEEYRITLSSESGTTDQLNWISGLNEGRKVILRAASGHTITVAAGGAYLFVAEENFELSGNDRMLLISNGGGTMDEISRSHNGVIVIYPLDDYFAAISLGSYPNPSSTQAERAYAAAALGLRKSL